MRSLLRRAENATKPWLGKMCTHKLFLKCLRGSSATLGLERPRPHHFAHVVSTSSTWTIPLGSDRCGKIR